MGEREPHDGPPRGPVELGSRRRRPHERGGDRPLPRDADRRGPEAVPDRLRRAAGLPHGGPGGPLDQARGAPGVLLRRDHRALRGAPARSSGRSWRPWRERPERKRPPAGPGRGRARRGCAAGRRRGGGRGRRGRGGGRRDAGRTRRGRDRGARRRDPAAGRRVRHLCRRWPRVRGADAGPARGGARSRRRHGGAAHARHARVLSRHGVDRVHAGRDRPVRARSRGRLGPAGPPARHRRAERRVGPVANIERPRPVAGVAVPRRLAVPDGPADGVRPSGAVGRGGGPPAPRGRRSARAAPRSGSRGGPAAARRA